MCAVTILVGRGSPELQQVRLLVRFSLKRLRFSLCTHTSVLLYSDTVRCPGDNSIKLCLPRSVDALGRLTIITIVHGACDRPRCLRVVNSGIHAPHPLDLRGVIIKPPKPPILLNFEHLKHRGPCRQRPLSSLEEKTMDLNSTIPLAIAAAFLVEVIMYLSSRSVIGQM